MQGPDKTWNLTLFWGLGEGRGSEDSGKDFTAVLLELSLEEEEFLRWVTVHTPIPIVPLLSWTLKKTVRMLMCMIQTPRDNSHLLP